MALINGVYKDKGRSMTLRTSIVKDIRVRDYAVASTDRISYNPNNAAYCDVGEWVQMTASDGIDRPSQDPSANDIDATHSTISGTVNCVTRPALVWYERGGTDVQAVQKVPIIVQGTIEIDTYMWAAETGIAAGEELCVVYADGDNAKFVTSMGFTGIKGILTTPTTVATTGNIHTIAGIGQNIWIVGVAMEAAVAGAPLLAQIYSMPFQQQLTVA